MVATAQNGLDVVRLGGLDSGPVASPYQVVERTAMYRLRHYFPDEDESSVGAPIVLIPPMMLAAEVYDVGHSPAVGILHGMGLDPWVVDFGSPDREDGGMRRTLTDHIVALDEIIDRIHEYTGRDVHVAGYSQGGMFAYQTVAFRRSRNVASIVTFGSPVDTLSALPLGIPAGLATVGADFLADHVFNRLAITGWMARIGFQLLDPVKTVRSRIDFVRQLHDRDALLPREPQRRFLDTDGWVAWSGPAVAELLKQFVVHNRMVGGGFVIEDRAVSLADITCPVLAFVGAVDDIGQPRAVRGIRRAAPDADGVYEYELRAGHFGLVVGSLAERVTWPTAGAWVRWREGVGERPDGLEEMSAAADDADEDVSFTTRITHTLETVGEVGAGVGRGIVGLASDTARGVRDLSEEAVRALPRLTRLGQIRPRTRISMAAVLTEHAERNPSGECFLFDDRMYTFAQVDARISNVTAGLILSGVRPSSVVGVLMHTRPSALSAITAVSRLGAVAALLPPGDDAAAAARAASIECVVTDPEHLDEAVRLGVRVLVLGGGDVRALDLDAIDADVEIVDMEQIDVESAQLPGWYVPNPGTARELAFVLFSGTGESLRATQITNRRWALSAFGTAAAASIDQRDTVYCLTPLHHSSALLVAAGGALVGGARIALARDFDPARFREEIYRYGVTIVSYTWTKLRGVVDTTDFALDAGHPIRLFIGSGMPAGLWRRTVERFAPAKVLDFYASVDSDVVLTHLRGTKPGCAGQPLPGSATVQLAAFDPVTGKFPEDDKGFARRAEDGEVGLLLAKPSAFTLQLTGILRGVFEPGDVWIPTENLFRRDADGDLWLLDSRRDLIVTAHGPVFRNPIVDALDEIARVDQVVVYPVVVDGATYAIAAVTAPGQTPVAAEIAAALADIEPGERPDFVHVVDAIAESETGRPLPGDLTSRGIPAASAHSWAVDRTTGEVRRLTKALRSRAVEGPATAP